MEKIFGAKERQDGVVRVSSRSYILFFGYGEENGNGYNYRARFDHKPSVSELREVIEAHVNGLTDAKIVSGYEWTGKQVWLSDANQRNYANAFISKTLPVKIRVYDNKAEGETTSTVISLNTEEELDAFYQGMVCHVNACIEAGWQEKDSVDYEKLLEDC